MLSLKFVTNSAYSKGSPLNFINSTFGKDGPCLMACAMVIQASDCCDWRLPCSTGDGQGYLARGYVACCGVVTEQNSAVFPFRPVVCGLRGCVHIPGVDWFLIADRPARVYNGSEIAVYSGVVLRSEKRGTADGHGACNSMGQCRGSQIL